MGINKQLTIMQPQPPQHMSPFVVDLKAEVEARVAPYATDATKPPFSPAGLMVMAWVCRPDQDSDRISERQISDWILRTFEYYKRLPFEVAFRYSCGRQMRMQDDATELQRLATKRQKASDQYNVPLIAVNPPSMAKYPDNVQEHMSKSSSCRQYLRRALNKELTQFSRFLELPLDVRILIYEEVFRIHEPLVFRSTKSGGCLTVSVAAKATFCNEPPEWLNEINGTTPDSIFRRMTDCTIGAPRLMALLLVHRQIFNEAAAVLYKVNHFCASSILHLAEMLRQCGPERFRCFTRISFEYCDLTSESEASEAFALLAQVDRIRQLKITIQDKMFLAPDPNGDPPRFKSVEEMPGMKLLGSIDVESLECHGDCPRIAAYLRERIFDSQGELGSQYFWSWKRNAEKL